MLGDEERDIFCDGRIACRRFLQQDGDPHLKSGRLYGDSQTTSETGSEAWLDTCDLFRERIAGDDDLLVSVDQRVQGIEELLLRTRFVSDELDVVYQQQIQRIIKLFEFIEVLCLERAHDTGNVIGGVDITDLGLRVLLADQIAYGLQQVG